MGGHFDLLNAKHINVSSNGFSRVPNILVGTFLNLLGAKKEILGVISYKHIGGDFFNLLGAKKENIRCNFIVY